ncbi:hypothetical protein IC006_0411 [Sulfuracidifex tepidarius]|uniref:HPP transmembrane region domain-containing protein n=1 Tax=Sulfuracidifex tepidarius TaxID=1294262 RepID=A0A510DSN1_9CREN|nr:HPP family protein [Sulfuracidifex tepidarius]BBG23127.1 hypothetical protein IC006_0411 [Sulfuracidifex tepidarius]
MTNNHKLESPECDMMQFPSKKKKAASVLNLVISISVLVAVTVTTKTEFILPPFLATAATKYPDPDWRMNRSVVILFSYVLCSVIGLAFSLLGLHGIIMASIASFISFSLCVLMNIEHPPAVLATFLGVLERVHLFYIVHPIITGVIIVEGVNYLLTKYVEPRLG